LQKLAAKERLEAGVIPIRIGRERARDRKARERKQGILIPVKKGDKPVGKGELQAALDQARTIKQEVEMGLRAPVPVDLEAEQLEPLGDETFAALKDAARSVMNTRSRGFVDALSLAASSGDDETT
jgi:hypothetical protein